MVRPRKRRRACRERSQRNRAMASPFPASWRYRGRSRGVPATKGKICHQPPLTEDQGLPRRCCEIRNNLFQAVGVKIIQNGADELFPFAAVRSDLPHDKESARLVLNGRPEKRALLAPLQVAIGPDDLQKKVPSREDSFDCFRGNHVALPGESLFRLRL